MEWILRAARFTLAITLIGSVESERDGGDYRAPPLTLYAIYPRSKCGYLSIFWSSASDQVADAWFRVDCISLNRTGRRRAARRRRDLPFHASSVARL
jgi:hypothetical protein